MSNERIFVGNIHKCTRHTRKDHHVNNYTKLTHVIMKHELYKENATLMKTKTGFFADIDGLDIRDLALLYNTGIGDELLPTEPDFEGQLFVDEKSLVNYNTYHQIKPKIFSLLKKK